MSRKILTLYFSLASLFLLSFFLFVKKEGKIERIVVQHRGVDRISPLLFAELLSLSVDQPLALRECTVQRIKQKLWEQGVFTALSLHKRAPHTLLVGYELARPLFIWGNRENRLLNEVGTSMPYLPFFTPKRLPLVYIEEELVNHYFPMICFIAERIRGIESIDFLHVTADSKARREIVLSVRHHDAEDIIRLDPATPVEEQLMRYTKLPKGEGKRIVDLRFPFTAYLKN